MQKKISFISLFLISLFYFQSNLLFGETNPVYTIIDNSGILGRIPQITEIVFRFSERSSKVNKVYESSEFRTYFVDFLQKGLSEEEKEALNNILKDPFISKVSKIFFKHIEDKTRFKKYIQRFGVKANKEKVELLSRLKLITNANATQPAFQMYIEKAIHINSIQARQLNKKIEEYEQMAKLYADQTNKRILADESKVLLQHLYFHSQGVSIQELKRFIEVVSNNELLVKFFNLSYQAKIGYYKKIYYDMIKS